MRGFLGLLGCKKKRVSEDIPADVAWLYDDESDDEDFDEEDDDPYPYIYVDFDDGVSDTSNDLDVNEAALIWASNGKDEDYTFGFTEDELEDAL